MTDTELIDIKIEDNKLKEPRLIDGICYPSYRINTGVCQDRIKTKYKEGAGDCGYSELFKGLLISKAAPAAKIYGCQEHLQQSISKAILKLTPNKLDELLIFLRLKPKSDHTNTVLVLSWLRDSLHSLGAFAYAKGDSTDHLFPNEFLDYMRQRIKFVKELIGPSKDFIIYGDYTLLYINDIRIKSRDLERAYWTWFQTKEIREFLYAPENVELLNNAKYMGKCLNRASAWMWNECRYVAYTKGIKDEKIWTSKMNPFPIIFD